MPEQNFADQLWNGLADAVADIREKVVEEPWFGRVVTERGDAPEWPKAEEPNIEPQGMSGETLGPEHEAQSYNPSSDRLLEHGQVIDNEPARWPEAREPGPSQSLEDRSSDIDIDR